MTACDCVVFSWQLRRVAADACATLALRYACVYIIFNCCVIFLGVFQVHSESFVCFDCVIGVQWFFVRIGVRC
jgi:hypothetical protein